MGLGCGRLKIFQADTLRGFCVRLAAMSRSTSFCLFACFCSRLERVLVDQVSTLSFFCLRSGYEENYPYIRVGDGLSMDILIMHHQLSLLMTCTLH